GNSQTGDHDPHNQTHPEKAIQILRAIQHRVTEKHQRDIVEIEFQPQQTVHDVRGECIEDFDESERSKKPERNEERRLENVHFPPPFCEIKRKVGHGDQEILVKVHRHAVAKILAGEVLKQEPNQEYENATAPIIEGMHNERNHNQTQ